MNKPDHQGAVVLTFVRGNAQRWVVTDGEHVAVYSSKGRVFVPRLSTAISRLEARGYRIRTDLFVTT